MKRIIIFVLTAVILLSMGGCTKKKADNTVEVFCLNMDVTSSGLPSASVAMTVRVRAVSRDTIVTGFENSMSK